MQKLAEIFQQHSRCFIPFVTAGHPDLESTRKIVLELAQAGAQIIEIGIPFSDPIADGPVIQRSSFQALQHGYRMRDYLNLIREIRCQSDVGLIFMSYLNPLLQFGLQRLDREGSDVGLNGILISDLTPEEAPDIIQSIANLDAIFMVAPTSSDRRVEKIAEVATGFLYLVARTGVTGARTAVGDEILRAVERVRRYTQLPVAVGFGISSAADVRKVWETAEAAIVGSAIVQFIDQNQSRPDLAERVGVFVKRTFLCV